MLKTLVWKESRELVPLIAVALIGQLYVVSTAMGIELAFLSQDHSTIPFVGNDVISMAFLVSGLAGAGLGFWQTWWESSRGTFQFLLHRPMPRERIVTVKLLIGLAITLLVSIAPILVYAFWAMRPTTHASPFLWGMTAWAWQYAMAMPLVYLGAFLSGLRPGCWFGSRPLPLLAAIMCVVFVVMLNHWLALQLLIVGVVAVGYTIAIFYVARTRDFS